jgi:hypothetical protein
MSYDGYSECEMGVAKIVAEIPDLFKPGAVTQGDYRPLELGFDRACVILPGAFNSSRIGSDDGSEKQMEWTIAVEIFQRYNNPSTVFAEFRRMRSEVINALETHPTLQLDGDVQVRGILGTHVTSGDQPGFVSKEGTDVTTHVTQTLYLQVSQIVEYSGGEYN